MVSEDLPPQLPLDSASPSSNSITMWLVGFLLLLKARYYISDAGMNSLLKFLCLLFRVLGRFSPVIATLTSSFPSSVYSLEKSIKHSIQFKKFVVCCKCHCLYRLDSSFILTGTHLTSKSCTFVRFPDHPLCRFRVACGQLLLKKVIFSSGRQIMYPFKVFPYRPLSWSLQHLLLRPGFSELCQHWKFTRSSDNIMQDVYDGQVWKDFQEVSGLPFLSSSYCFGLMVNVDWFQPYKHTTCSVGAIYLTVMNLPRSVRFKRENMILVGILPGPSEPKHDINSYLEPLVNELLDLWTGVSMQVRKSSEVSQEVVKCALLCVACDLPAGRKLCGFLGHSAKLGCSKCLKQFPGTVGSMNYSGFDRSQWPSRTNEGHRRSIQKVQQGKTKQGLNTLESSEGCRYSCLLKLPYFDAPRMLSIDPMHNLFLGSGKYMMQLWLRLGIINSIHFTQLQEFVDNMCVPSDIGRIPHKIATGFSSFTADQFKNWIALYSVPALHGILPRPHFECWRVFVLACRIICRRKLTTVDISLFDGLLMKFCTQVQNIYGESAITPNMHMHGHLKQVMEDFGPVYAFWLFAYERYNGILGSQPSNNRSIETQLMNRFLKDNCAYDFQFPDEFSNEFGSLCLHNNPSVGSLGATLSGDKDCADVVTSACRRYVFDTEDMSILLSLYRKLNPEIASGTDVTVTVNAVYAKYTSINLQGKPYSCSRSSRKGSQYVAVAQWDETLFGPPPTPLPDATHPDSKYRPVKIRHYIRASVCRGGNTCQLLLAVVQWFKPHSNKNGIGKPAQIWCYNTFENGAMYCFLPVKLLVCRCSFIVTSFDGESVLIVVPLSE